MDLFLESKPLWKIRQKEQEENNGDIYAVHLAGLPVQGKMPCL